MNAKPSKSLVTDSFYRPDKYYPICFAIVSLLFIYVFQYPLSQLIGAAGVELQYDWDDWFFAYIFIIISAVFFVVSLYFGMSGKPTKIVISHQPRWTSQRVLRLPTVLIWFSLFFLWTYLMLSLKVGMTFYTDFDPLPFKLVGFLVYGRLFIQPLFLAYIARGYSNSSYKWIIFVLLVAIGAWVSLSSGSRFAGIMFALPMLLLFKSKSKYVAFGVAALLYITIASLSRHFYLPFIVGGDYIEIYANEDYQATVTENLFLLPILYVVGRPMGMAEVLMTLRFGEITPSFADSLLSFLSYFLPFVTKGDGVSIKNIYGFEDDTFGGFGLDLFSNYWYFFGGSFILYGLGLAVIGWMLGRAYRLLSIALMNFGFREGSMLIFVLLFILVFEGRSFLVTVILMVAYLVSHSKAPQFIDRLLKPFAKKHYLPDRNPVH